MRGIDLPASPPLPAFFLAARVHFRLEFNEVHFFWQMKSNDRPGASLVSVHSGCTLSGNLLSCLLGTLASGGTQSVVIQLIWNNVGANTAITTAVSSDVPDSVATNNTASIPITQDMTANNNADIPILPEWGMLAMGFLLVLIMYTRKRA